MFVFFFINVEQITLQDDVSSSSDDSFEDDCSAEAIMPQVRTFTFNDSNLAEWEKYTKVCISWAFTLV